MLQAEKKHPEWITITYARDEIVRYSRQGYTKLIDLGVIDGRKPEPKTSSWLINTASLYRYLDTLK